MSGSHIRSKVIGDLAENYFESLCIESGLTRSRPGKDEQGWDFFVEMPPSRLPLVYLDAQPAPIKFLCQVKDTDVLKNSQISIKISNLEHFARTVLPCFIFLIDYNTKNTPETIYLAHFNSERIAQTLKKLESLRDLAKQI